jgi:hypothetical protein
MDRTLEFVWGQHRSWAATARTLKNQITRNGVIVLGLTLAGTAVGTLTPTFIADGNSTPAKVLGLLAAALLGVATYLTSQLLGDSDRQNWVKAELGEGPCRGRRTEERVVQVRCRRDAV